MAAGLTLFQIELPTIGKLTARRLFNDLTGFLRGGLGFWRGVSFDMKEWPNNLDLQLNLVPTQLGSHRQFSDLL
jgi:hypothetical protein